MEIRSLLVEATKYLCFNISVLLHGVIFFKIHSSFKLFVAMYVGELRYLFKKLEPVFFSMIFLLDTNFLQGCRKRSTTSLGGGMKKWKGLETCERRENP